MEVNVYSQYFAAEGSFSGVPRHAALVMLISDSEAGTITYRAAVTFFPHNAPDDFAVSYDAYFEQQLYSAPGRRSRKRESALLASLRDVIDSLSAAHSASVDWSQPLGEARE